MVAALGCASTERNKQVAQQVFSEILEGRRIERAKELYHPDFKNHGLGRDADLTEDMKALQWLQAAAPSDMRMRPDAMVAEGDMVSVLWTASGTKAGVHRAFQGVTIWRIVDGRVRDEWSVFDELGMARWLGLLQEPVKD